MLGRGVGPRCWAAVLGHGVGPWCWAAVLGRGVGPRCWAAVLVDCVVSVAVPRTPPSSPLPCPLSLCTSPPAGPPWDAPPLVPVQSVRPNSPVLLSPTPAAFRALVHAPPARGRAGGEEGALRRMSVRQCESAYHYKDIVVKKCASYTQLWLVTQTRAKNALNPQVRGGAEILSGAGAI